MIAKIIKGRGFRGAVSYLLLGNEKAHDKRAEIIGGNMAGNNPRAIAKEFSALRQLRPTLGKAVCHISLSLPPDERTVSNEEMQQIANQFMDGMGFTDCPFLVVRHHDTAHEHIHILASRIKADGSVVSDKQDFHRAEVLLRTIENKHGLRTPIPSADAPKTRRKRRNHTTKGDLIMSNKQDLSREIGFALSSATDFEQFIREANKREITVVPVIENGSEVKTVRYRYKNYLIGAGKLGPEYEWKTIAPKFGHDPIHICLTQIGMLSKQQDIFDNQIFCPITKEEDAREIRRKVVESDYFEGMWSTLSPEIEDAAIVKNAIQIRLQDGGRLSDHGTHVYAIDMSHQQAAEMLMRMALHKKWQTIQLRGNDVFLQNAMGIALDNGVEIDPLDEHQEKILAKVIGKRKSQGGGMGEGMNGPAPNMDHALNSLLGDRAVKSKMFEESKTKPRTKRPGGRV